MTFQTYFQFDTQPISIYPYAPVYKHTLQDKAVIIKKTKSDPEKLKALLNWQRHLVQEGIDTLLPVCYKGHYYHVFEGENWIVYPFVKGHAYTGHAKEIQAAGQLLGQLHHVSETHYFNHGFDLDDYDDDFWSDVQKDMIKIKQTYPIEASSLITQKLFEQINKQVNNKCHILKKWSLPKVDGHWDYKASNLIYHSNGLTLIDTDNAGHIPRIFDLALALLLFHTAEENAPSRPFTPEEWQLFYQAYSQHVTLTPEEKAAWSDYLIFVYLDEVLWAINDLEDNDSQRQKDFIRSLVTFDYERYTL